MKNAKKKKVVFLGYGRLPGQGEKYPICVVNRQTHKAAIRLLARLPNFRVFDEDNVIWIKESSSIKDARQCWLTDSVILE